MNATAAPDPMAAARTCRNARVWIRDFASGDSLRVAPAESLTDSQRATLRTHKPALIALLTDAKASMLSGQGRSESSRPADPSTLLQEPAPDVRCSDCRHGQPATPSDPWSWHRRRWARIGCMAGAWRRGAAGDGRSNHESSYRRRRPDGG